MKKLSFFAIPLLFFALVLTVAHLVSAKENNDKKTPQAVKSIEKAINKLEKIEDRFDFTEQEFNQGNVPETLNIVGPKGHVRINAGKVTDVASSTFTVSVWKINFTVHKMPDTKVRARGGGHSTFENVKVGDVVDVQGTLDADKLLFVHAGVVHNRSIVSDARQAEAERLRAVINELIERLNKLLKDRTAPPAIPPSSSELKIGDRIMTTVTVNVTTDPLTDPAMVLGSQATSTQGVILSGPRAVSGTNWWEINFDSGADGYVNGSHLKKN